MEYVLCPICGASESTVFGAQEGFLIVVCRQCGLMYVNPRRALKVNADHFIEEYISGEERVQRVFTEARKHALQSESRIIKNLLPSGGRLLDVGSASGAFLSRFASCPDWSVEGIEPSRFAAEYARKRYGLTIHAGFLMDHRFSERSFEVVTCLDTFGYVPDPNSELAEIARILVPKGFLAMEIPGLNFRLLKNTGLICRLMYGAHIRLDPALQLYYYAAKTLDRLVARHGFEVVSHHAMPSPDSGSALLRVVKRVYFRGSSAVYKLTDGRVNYVPKEFIIYEKAVT